MQHFTTILSEILFYISTTYVYRQFVKSLPKTLHCLSFTKKKVLEVMVSLTVKQHPYSIMYSSTLQCSHCYDFRHIDVSRSTSMDRDSERQIQRQREKERESDRKGTRESKRGRKNVQKS